MKELNHKKWGHFTPFAPKVLPLTSSIHMKTRNFLFSTLIAAAAMSANAYAANTLTESSTTITETSSVLSEYKGVYSGNIIELTAKGSTGFHDGTFYVYSTDGVGAISRGKSTVSGTGNVSLTNNGEQTSSQFLWHYFAGKGAQVGSVTYGQTLYVSSETLKNSDLIASMTFSPIAIGGLIVGESSHGFETGRIGGNASLALVGADSIRFVADIRSDTILHANQGISVLSDATWTVAQDKTLTLDSATGITIAQGKKVNVLGQGTLKISSAISNSGTITFGDGATLALTGVTASSSVELDESQTKLQDVSSTYAIATGGTIVGLKASNVTVNGDAVTSVTADGRTATISKKVYNIGTGSTVSYSDISVEDLDSADYINVAGTLTSDSALTGKSIHGTGRLQLSLTVDVNPSLKDSAAWTGTVVLGSIGSGKTLANYGNESSTLEISSDFKGYWYDQNDGTIKSDLVFCENVEIVDGYNNGTLTIVGSISGEKTFEYKKANAQSFIFNGMVDLKGMKFSAGSGSKTFNNVVTLDSFSSVGGTVSFNGATDIKTLTVSGGTLTLSGNTTKKITTLSASGKLLTQNEGALVISGQAELGSYTGSKGETVSSSITIEEGASLTVGGDFTLRQEHNFNTNQVGATMNISGDVSVGGNLWIARDGKGIINIDDGGKLTANTLTFGQRWAGKDSKGSVVNVASGATLVAGAIVANTDKNAGDGDDILNTSSLNLNGGIFGTSSDSLDVNVVAGKQTLAITLGKDTTSTINTGKYVDGAFSATGATISIKSAISGDGALKVDGVGTLVLSGKNTYSGGTEISGGTLKIDSAAWSDKGNLGSAFGYDKLVLKNGGILEVTAAQNTKGDGTAYGDGGAYRGFSVTEGEGTFRFSGEGTSYLAYNGENQYVAVADGAMLKFDVVHSGSTLGVDKIFRGVDELTTSGNIEKIGAGTLVLSGNNNNYSGGTTLSAGTLIAGNANALGSGTLKLNGGTFGVSDSYTFDNEVVLGEGTTSTININQYVNGAFNTTSNKQIAFTNVISGSGALIVEGTLDTVDNAQLLTLSGDNSYSGGTTLNGARVVAGSSTALGSGTLSMNGAEVQINTDTLTVKNLNGSGRVQLGNNTTNSVLTIETTETSTFSGNLISGDFSKTLALIKTGAETLTLSGTNHLGAVTVSEGTLSIVGSSTLLTSDVTLTSDTSRFQIGVIQFDDATYEGVSITGALNLANDSKLLVDLSKVVYTGETITLNIVSAAGRITLNWTEAAADGLMTLADADPSITDYVDIVGAEHLSAYVNKTWNLEDNNITLTLAIPEPSLFGLLAGLGALTLVGTRRRKRA